MLKISKQRKRVGFAGSVVFVLLLASASLYAVISHNAYAFDGGDGSSGNPYQISNCEELQDVSDDLSASYELTSDIDCSDTANWNGGEGLAPLGDGSTPFTGTFNGQNFTIEDLTISQPDNDTIGLFGVTSSATIENLYIDSSTISGETQVGSISGQDSSSTFTNISLTAMSVTGTGQQVGGIVGSSTDTTINNSDFQGTLDSPDAIEVGGFTGFSVRGHLDSDHSNVVITSQYSAGGIAGETYGGTIQNVYAEGTITGGTNVGGIFGDADMSIATTIEDSYSNASLDATNLFGNVGGLVGTIQSNTGDPVPTLSNNFATGTITGGADGSLGGLIGAPNTPVSIDVSSDWFDEGTTGQSSCDGYDETTCNTTNDGNTGYYENSSNAPLSSWNFSGTWEIPDGGGLPVLGTSQHSDPVIIFDAGSGTESDPYQINSCLMLEGMQQHLSSYFELTADIDCSESAVWNGGKGYEPVGDNNTPFTGSFNGNGDTISNISSIRADDDSTTTNSNDPADNQDYIGLFGYTNDATVTNLHITHSKMKGYQYVGGIIGYMNGGTLSYSSYNIGTADNDCSADVADGGQCVWARYGLDGGGLVGYLTDGGAITDSQTAGPVKGSGNIIGGLVGVMDQGSTLSDSSSSSNVNGGSYIGGAVGEMLDGSTVSDTSVTGNVYATLDDEVNKPGYYAGGFAGNVDNSTITSSSATGTVHADVSYAGGFVGTAQDTSTIEDSYSIGAVDAGTGGMYGYYIGGFAGALGSGTYARDYSSGSVTAIGGYAGGFVGTLNQYSGDSLTDSFATGLVTGPTVTGGFIADTYSYNTLTNDYYDQTTTGQDQCSGITSDGNEACTAVNTDGSDENYFTDSTNAPFTESRSAVWTPSTWLFDGTHLPVLVTGLSGPVLNLPTAGQVVRNLHINVDVPVNPQSGSSMITLVGPTTITIQLSNLGVGDHVFDIDAANIIGSPNVVSSSPGNTIPNGTYTVVYSYQPNGGGAPVSDTVENVDITSVAQMLCYESTSTDTTAFVHCITSPDEYGTTTWQVRYAPQGSTNYTNVVLGDDTVGEATITGLTPGTTYDVQLAPTNSYTGVYGTDGWGTVVVTTTGTAPASSSPSGTKSSSAGTTGSGATNVPVETAQQIATATGPTTASTTTYNATTPSKAVGTITSTKKSTSVNWWWLIILIIVVGLVIIIIAARRRKPVEG